MQESDGGKLQKNLGFSHGLALYLAAVLGTGILIVPLLSWREAGASSLIAWVALGFLGFALAWTFASAGSRYPNAGGVQSLIGQVFGSTMETLSQYLVFFSVPAGSVPAAYIFAQHVTAAFRLPEQYVAFLAIGSWILVAGANYLGLRISARAQLVLSALLVALLTFVVFAALPHVQKNQFVPFAPVGVAGIGNAALLIFWSFMGWEAIAHLAEEFHNPRRDMIRAATVAAVIVGVLYFAVTFVLIGSGIFHQDAGKNAPLVDMAERLFGGGGRTFTGLLAAVICLGTMNAYMAGLSRLGYSMARDGNLPAFLSKIDASTGTPRNSVVFLLSMNLLGMAVQLYFNLSLAPFFRLQNVAFLLLYLFGCIAVARLLRGERIAVFCAYFAAIICAAMIPFAHGAILYPTGICFVALLWITIKRKGFTEVRQGPKEKL